ncbi:MAG: TauD/TfdA family dioxygenase [Pseudomonadota bacterium]
MIRIEPLGDTIGAEVTGIDLSQINDADFQSVYQAFLDHIVLVFRDQELSMEQFLAQGQRFGPIRPHIVRKSRHPDLPQLMVIDNKIVDTKVGAVDAPSVNLVKRGALWHTDTSYDYISAKATQFYARAIPSSGGDTLFASAYAIYDSLPKDLTLRLRDLRASYKYGGRLRRNVELLEDDDRVRPPAVHSLVRVHPETGREAIYFNPGQVIRIDGMSEPESDALIEELTPVRVTRTTVCSSSPKRNSATSTIRSMT